MASIPLLDGLRPLAQQYDALFCDVWGVLHNGERAYPHAARALQCWREQGGRTLLLTNAPRSSIRVRKALEEFGITDELHDGVVSSGDVLREAFLAGEFPRECYYLGPERDRVFIKEAGVVEVDEADAARVLCVGLRDEWNEQAEDYRSLLEGFVKRRAKMLCANPDLVAGARLLPCAGALAQLYDSLGGETLYFGKPHASIYHHAWKCLEEVAGAPVAKSRVLALGDGIATDILGAARFGLDAVFITGGISALEVGEDALTPSPEKLAAFYAEHGVQPVAAMTKLAW